MIWFSLAQIGIISPNRKNGSNLITLRNVLSNVLLYLGRIYNSRSIKEPQYLYNKSNYFDDIPTKTNKKCYSPP